MEPRRTSKSFARRVPPLPAQLLAPFGVGASSRHAIFKVSLFRWSSTLPYRFGLLPPLRGSPRRLRQRLSVRSSNLYPLFFNSARTSLATSLSVSNTP